MKDWRVNALCRRMDYRIWDSGLRARQDWAVHLCRSHCPVLEACRAHVDDQQRSELVQDRYAGITVGGLVIDSDKQVVARPGDRRCELCARPAEPEQDPIGAVPDGPVPSGSDRRKEADLSHERGAD